MPTEAGIRLEHVGFGYGPDGGPRLFDDFSLDLQRGRVTVILGPSGIGKSTLLGLIAGTLRPLAGRVRFCDSGQPAPRPTIGLVFQAATLIPWRTVLSNALFGVEIRQRENRGAALKQARALLQRFGLGDSESYYPFQLSGGMQQRVSIVRALVSGAAVLLLDEPFSNSDFVARRLLQREISRAVDAENIVAVLVTHDLNDALRLGDRIMIVADRPVAVIDSFDVDIPREQRLNDEPSAIDALKPYFERVWNIWARSGAEASAHA